MTSRPARRSTQHIEPGSTEWLQLVTASKVSAILGLSPWESRFALWHRMAGNLEPDLGNDATRRGTYHEAGVLAWFKDQHPELTVRANRHLWVSRANPRYAATPDGFTTGPDGREGIEIKTTTADGWGRPGTDDIPPHYRAQCVWQAHIIGLPRIRIAILGKYLNHAEYFVTYEPDEAAFIQAEVDAFLHSLDVGIPPSLDDHQATADAVRNLHPDISDDDATIDPELAVTVLLAKAAKTSAEDNYRLAMTRVADAMGDARRAVCNGHQIATRTSRGGATPHLVLSRSLPDINQITDTGGNTQ